MDSIDAGGAVGMNDFTILCAVSPNSQCRVRLKNRAEDAQMFALLGAKTPDFGAQTPRKNTLNTSNALQPLIPEPFNPWNLGEIRMS